MTDNNRKSTDMTEQETPHVQPAEAIDEHFDFDSISLSTDFRSTHQLKKPLTQIPIRKPGKQVFFRTYPDTSWWSHTKVLELHDDLREGYIRETYVVTRSLWEEVESKEPLAERILVPYITRNGDVLIWPIKIQEQGSRGYTWFESALNAAHRAVNTWVRLQSNMVLQCYVAEEAAGEIPEPEWPTLQTKNELLNIAFKGRIISHIDHDVLRRLRGAL
jgi:hypothetical protein